MRLHACAFEISGCCQGTAFGVTPHAIEVGPAEVLWLVVEQQLPFAKDLVHHPRGRYPFLSAPHIHIFLIDVSGRLIRGRDGDLVVALNRRGITDKVDGVGGMHLMRERIRAKVGQGSVSPYLGELFVSGLRPDVVRDRLRVLTHSNVDMGGHVHDVARYGHG